jgi:hypothetical protein
MRDLARRLWRLGYAPIPLGGDRVPLVRWSGYHLARPSPEEIRAWPWDRALGVGVVTGPAHGVVMVDFDSTEAWSWALDTLRAVRGVRSRRGGHLHFSHPARGVIGCRSGDRAVWLAPGVAADVKGLGGLAVAPGSRHPSGITYEPLGDWTSHVSELPELPAEIARLAEDRPPPPPRPTPRRRRKRESDPVRAIDAYLAKVGGLPEQGAGSDAATFRAAAWARHNAADLTEEQFVAAIQRVRPEWDERWIASKWRSARP